MAPIGAIFLSDEFAGHLKLSSFDTVLSFHASEFFLLSTSQGLIILRAFT